MKIFYSINWALAILLSLWLGGNKTSNKEAEKGTVVTENRDFAKGADVSWATQMESQGHVFNPNRSLEKHSFFLSCFYYFYSKN